MWTFNQLGSKLVTYHKGTAVDIERTVHLSEGTVPSFQSQVPLKLLWGWKCGSGGERRGSERRQRGREGEERKSIMHVMNTTLLKSHKQGIKMFLGLHACIEKHSGEFHLP